MPFSVKGTKHEPCSVAWVSSSQPYAKQCLMDGCRAATVTRATTALQISPSPAEILHCALALPSAGLVWCVLRTAVRWWLYCMEPGRVKPHLNISFSEQLKIAPTHAAVVGFIILSVQPCLSVCGLTSCWQQWEADCSTAWLQASACSLCGHHSSWQHPFLCQPKSPHVQLCCCCHTLSRSRTSSPFLQSHASHSSVICPSCLRSSQPLSQSRAFPSLVPPVHVLADLSISWLLIYAAVWRCW